jgi:sugar phosphate isomerase/epimerase
MSRIGLHAYSLTGPSGRELCEPDIHSLLRTAKQLGAEGLLAKVPDSADQIREAFELAAELNLYLEPSVPLPLDWHGDASRIAQREQKFHLVCRLAAEHGARTLHCAMGARERFEDLPRWKAFVATTAECLQHLAPELRERGIRIGLENHWDYSTYEILDIVHQVGADVVGVGLDTGNLLVLAEAPDRAIERAAPVTATVHLKDAMLFSTPRGAVRPVTPIGQGQVGVAEAIRVLYGHNPGLNFTIEDHPGLCEVEYLEPWWLAALPELTTYDIATTARLAREGDRWLAEHRVPDPHTAELVPWSIRGLARLEADILAVKQMLHDVQADPCSEA